MKIVSRKWNWPFNAILFNISKLYPCRDQNIWVFGAHAGNKYDDNSRYLFEYVNQWYKNDIRCVWIASEENVVHTIRNKGYESYLWNSSKGRSIALKAGVCFYTHSIYDFGMFPLVGGSLVVALWHGVSFKLIYNASYRGIKKVLKRCVDKIFARSNRDVTIATSQYSVNEFANYFNINKNKIYITGQPRNDIIKCKYHIQDILPSLFDILCGKKIVLYMPTYRSIRQGEDAVSKIIENLYVSKELDELLERKNYVFLVKLHPLTPVPDLPNRSNFVILDYESVEENQKLLASGDILITDYSSCFVDFALTKRPILFYLPDDAEYLKHSGKNDKMFGDICSMNCSSNPNELANKLEKLDNNVYTEVNKVFEDKSIENSCYSENVYNVIRKKTAK